MAFVPRPTRRELLHLVGATGLVLASRPGCSRSGAASPAAALSNDERSALGALANAVIPPDDEPGGEALGAVEYIERLITAFDAAVPAIFAGGPYSGRQPFPDGAGHGSASAPANDFSAFVELDRVSALAWRLRVLGSASLPGGAPNDAIVGPVVGLRDQVKQGLAKAMAAQSAPLATLAPVDLAAAFDALDADFSDLLIDLVSEAAFAAPEYGGNEDLAGWRLCHFEGDSLPLGYSQWSGSSYVERPDAPLSTANAGPDPAPMDDETRQVLATAIAFLGGRTMP